MRKANRLAISVLGATALFASASAMAQVVEIQAGPAYESRPAAVMYDQPTVIGWYGDRYWDGQRYYERREWEEHHRDYDRRDRDDRDGASRRAYTPHERYGDEYRYDQH